MIDKVPETTTLQCTLPRTSVERVRFIAERQRISFDEAVAVACERWASEQERQDTTAARLQQPSAKSISKASLPIVEIWPDPPCTDEGESIPVELPHSSVTPIRVTKTASHWPERLWDDE